MIDENVETVDRVGASFPYHASPAGQDVGVLSDGDVHTRVSPLHGLLEDLGDEPCGGERPAGGDLRRESGARRSCGRTPGLIGRQHLGGRGGRQNVGAQQPTDLLVLSLQLPQALRQPDHPRVVRLQLGDLPLHLRDASRLGGEVPPAAQYQRQQQASTQADGHADTEHARGELQTAGALGVTGDDNDRVAALVIHFPQIIPPTPTTISTILSKSSESRNGISIRPLSAPSRRIRTEVPSARARACSARRA